MSFIHDDFLLETKTAQRLFHEYAANLPIIDYHNHLPPADIARNRRFANLFEIWLEGDHYKWRAMRANGSAERFCTGDAEPYDKFLAWAKTIPQTLRNPLYHWSHLELKRYFGIDVLLSEKTADEVWRIANEKLAQPELSVEGILAKFNVAALCTTDDPSDDLAAHIAIGKSGLRTKVFPTFRPDKALTVNNPDAFNAWINKLAAASNTDISTLPELLDALDKRHAFFHEAGCRLSDHGLSACYADFPSDFEAAAIFDRARWGKAASPDEHAKFAAHLMLHFGRLDAKRGWTKQLHLGPLRNNNSRAFAKLGPDTGFDSIGDLPQAQALSSYLDRLDQEGNLPKTILYNINPNDNYTLATMAGNFQDGVIPGKIQFGAGWWHLDTKWGMETQMNALSNVGLLSRFIGMLTDSRSFMSFPRHEYFRRVLCNLIGSDVERGEIPGDDELTGSLIRNICFENAKNYLGFNLLEETSK
ncbi:MAG: glucuronate isomerase [Capsulimonadaceae bacterium]|nr:glucuronate isomerase [Capsulimonadaceae bacterium]